jgi:hypothetical protein
MKSSILTFRLTIIAFLLFVTSGVFAAEYVRTIKRDFDIQKGSLLKIENKYGTIHCNHWDKPQITFEVRITAKTPSEKTANQLVRDIEIVWSASPTLVSAKTSFDKIDFPKNGKINVDYTVNMPSWINLELNNKFGDVFVSEISGKVSLNVAYGKLESNKLSHDDNKVEIQFGSCIIQQYNGKNLTLKYSQCTITTAKLLSIDSKYSDITGENIMTASMNCEGGSVKIQNINVAQITSRFTDLNIGKLEKNMALDIKYGNCSIKEVAADFESITVTNKYGNVEIGILSACSYTMDAELKFCDLDLPSFSGSTLQDVSSTRKSYKGLVGKNKNTTSKVTIRSEFGSISL